MLVDSELIGFLNGTVDSISAVARIMHVSRSTVHGWIKDGKIEATVVGHRFRVRYSDNTAFFQQRQLEYGKKPVGAYVPDELRRYAKWHQLLDAMTWLIKVSYSTTKQIKKRRFRMDTLLANYLTLYDVSLRGLQTALQPETTVSRGLITDDLKRGWYNELAFALPLKPATLGVSFGDLNTNEQRSVERFAFPSWRITAAYYSTYFYLRSITLHKQPNLRLQEHGAAIASFKNNALGPLSRTVWRFPFDISHSPEGSGRKQRRVVRGLGHLRHKYCHHPQPPHRSPAQLVDFIYQTFRRNGQKRGKPRTYTFLDYFHDFRVWANYLEIDSLLRLAGRGYKGFLDQNLSLALFFIGAFAELTYMAVFGEQAYSDSLKGFLELVVRSETVGDRDIVMIPHYQRLQIYRRLGLTSVWIEPRFTPDDNAVLSNGIQG